MDASRISEYVNWEGRPAVFLDGGRRAAAILSVGSPWTWVSPWEVADSGLTMARESFETAFADFLGALPGDEIVSTPAGDATFCSS